MQRTLAVNNSQENRITRPEKLSCLIQGMYLWALLDQNMGIIGKRNQLQPSYQSVFGPIRKPYEQVLEYIKDVRLDNKRSTIEALKSLCKFVESCSFHLNYSWQGQTTFNDSSSIYYGWNNLGCKSPEIHVNGSKYFAMGLALTSTFAQRQLRVILIILQIYDALAMAVHQPRQVQKKLSHNTQSKHGDKELFAHSILLANSKNVVNMSGSSSSKNEPEPVEKNVYVPSYIIELLRTLCFNIQRELFQYWTDDNRNAYYESLLDNSNYNNGIYFTTMKKRHIQLMDALSVGCSVASYLTQHQSISTPCWFFQWYCDKRNYLYELIFAEHKVDGNLSYLLHRELQFLLYINYSILDYSVQPIDSSALCSCNYKWTKIESFNRKQGKGGKSKQLTVKAGVEHWEIVDSLIKRIPLFVSNYVCGTFFHSLGMYERTIEDCEDSNFTDECESVEEEGLSINSSHESFSTFVTNESNSVSACANKEHYASSDDSQLIPSESSHASESSSGDDDDLSSEYGECYYVYVNRFIPIYVSFDVMLLE